MKDLKKIAKALIPLSLMTMGVAFAESEIADRSYSNCCPTDCCKPCCVPQPKKCIDCECYNPQFYDLQCDWGMFVTADFLYWCARETNIEFGFNQTFIKMPSSSLTRPFTQMGFNTKHHYVKTQWDPGFRVGLGFNFECDGWDLYANYTNFHNKTHSSTSNPKYFEHGSAETQAQINAAFGVDGLEFLIQPWAINNLTEDPYLSPKNTGKWSLNFNQVDLELGRKYWVSKCMTLRPYLGLRGAWTHTKFDVLSSWSSTIFLPVANQGPYYEMTNSNRFKNKYWGVGLLGGLQPEFMLGNWCGCGNFSIYGNIEAALLWGKFEAKNAFDYVRIFDQGVSDARGKVLIKRVGKPVEKDNYSRLQNILDIGLGLRWEEHWCCDRYSTSMDLGWEYHSWFEYGVYHKPSGVTNIDFRPTAPQQLLFPFDDLTVTSHLGFGGLVVRFRFDF